MADTFGSPDDTEREIRDGRIAAGDARVILMRRRYDAPVEDVWDACTDPDRLARFFMRPKGDLRVGGRFDFDGNAGGEILRCEPPRLLAVTWEYGDRPVDEVHIRLTPGDRGDTILELEHASVSRQVEIAGRSVDVLLNDPETGIWGLGPGWELGLLGLDAYIRGTFPSDPAAVATDPQILELANRCSDGWAAVLAGR
jgi:uncharacterized protein YndB with AHSA1/START domain